MKVTSSIGVVCILLAAIVASAQEVVTVDGTNQPPPAPTTREAGAPTTPTADVGKPQVHQPYARLQPSQVGKTRALVANEPGTITLTRGGLDRTSVEILKPSDASSATSNGRPLLYFYLSQPTTREIKATLSNGDTTLKMWTLPEGAVAGIHMLTLAPTDSELKVANDYVWSVQVMEFPGAGAAKNPFDDCELRRVAAENAPQVAGLPPAERLMRLAGAGLFQDALQELLSEQAAADEGLDRVSQFKSELQTAAKLLERYPSINLHRQAEPAKSPSAN